MVRLLSTDLSLVRRWSKALSEAGWEFSVIDRLQPPEIRSDGAICLVDLGTRGGTGLAGVLDAIAARRSARFAVLTARPDAQEGLRVLRAGGRGYCNRLASAEVAVALVAAIEGGEIWAGRQVTEFLLSDVVGAGSGGAPPVQSAVFHSLTPREAEIASQVAVGLDNKAIAEQNGISERTVKVHLNNIYRKTGFSNRIQLALARNQGPDTARKTSNG